jgi:hypothetical protein
MAADQAHSAEARGYIDANSAEREFGHLARYSDIARIGLEKSWDRTTRPNESIEIDALRSTLWLEAECGYALRRQDVLLAPSSAEQRFKLRAGMLVVTAVLPFPSYDRDRLRYSFTTYDMKRHHSSLPTGTLVANWRRWLRMDGNEPAERGSHNYGEATLLYEAALGILDVSSGMLGRGSSRPGKYQQTSFGLPQHE